MSLTNEDLTTIRNIIREELQTVTAGMESTETKLLTEVRKWATPLDQRMRAHKEAIRALDLQIEYVADRVTKLEPKH